MEEPDERSPVDTTDYCESWRDLLDSTHDILRSSPKSTEVCLAVCQALLAENSPDDVVVALTARFAEDELLCDLVVAMDELKGLIHVAFGLFARIQSSGLTMAMLPALPADQVEGELADCLSEYFSVKMADTKKVHSVCLPHFTRIVYMCVNICIVCVRAVNYRAPSVAIEKAQ